MENRDLQYFVVIAEHHNLGRAAEALNLSATALSKCLRRLEKSVGAKLIQRAPKGIALTTVGAALLTRIGPLQGMMADVRHEAADLAQGHAGHIHVGATTGAAENFIADACISLFKESSRITLEVTVAEAPTLGTLLYKGDVDFCVAGIQQFSQTDFVRQRLYDDQFVVFASANHRLASFKQVSLVDIASERWTAIDNTSRPHWQIMSRVFENSGLPPPSVALDTNSQAVRMQTVAYSDFLGVISRQLLRLEAHRFPLVELPVRELSLARHMSIIYRKGAYLSPAATRLIEILKTQVKEISDGGLGEPGSKRA